MIERVFRLLYPEFDSAPIEDIRLSPDPSVREAILWEYGLGPLLSYAIDPKMIESDAAEFIRQRGTLKSIRIAMKWVGFPAIAFTQISRTDYEIDSGRVPNEWEIRAIEAALSVSVQSRGLLKRIYHDTFELKYA